MDGRGTIERVSVLLEERGLDEEGSGDEWMRNRVWREEQWIMIDVKDIGILEWDTRHRM